MSQEPDSWGFPPPSSPARPLSPLPPRPRDSTASLSEPPVARSRYGFLLNIVLFVATVYSVFEVGQIWNGAAKVGGLRGWLAGWPFAVPLLVILLAHEFGHYIAARLHRVPASLPYFIPLPWFSPFGTFGAVIVMPRRIRSANALLDIGAAGPLAGMVVAIPFMLWGLSLSEVGPRSATNYIQEGQSILYWLLKTAMFGPISADRDVMLHPTALAAWAGFLVTFLNMLPFGQLDGGHVAYALLGQRQNRIARFIWFAPLVLMAYNAFFFVRPIVERGMREGFRNLPSQAWLPASAVTVWLGIFILVSLMRALSGSEHPPVDHAELSPLRRAIAIATLAMFVLLFMPTPWVVF